MLGRRELSMSEKERQRMNEEGMVATNRTVAIIICCGCACGFSSIGSSHHYCRFPKRVLYFHAFIISAEPHVISISLQKRTKKRFFSNCASTNNEDNNNVVSLMWFRITGNIVGRPFVFFSLECERGINCSICEANCFDFRRS